jgi:hypothetical protein
VAEIKPAEQIQADQAKVEADKAQLAKDEAVVTAETPTGSYYYCMEENHPGAPNFQTTPLSLTRIFQSDKEVPECPACQRQVNALPCEGPDIPPAFILELQERFGR